MPVVPSASSTSESAGSATASASWSFGIEADTQWSAPDDGQNPDTVSVGIIRQIDHQFVRKGVKFVVEVGDLCDNGTPAGEKTRAVFAQELYAHHIGFYPLRGNHDDGAADAREFTWLYPQTQSATMNMTPAAAFLIKDPDSREQPFPLRSGEPFRVGSVSRDPVAPRGFAGLDYAIDYRNARLIFLDQFASAAAPGHEALTGPGVTWMDDQLATRPAGTQAFVFGHKGIIMESHTDTLFGADPAADPSLQDAFIRDLEKSGVHYYFCGHDHLYNRALVTSPDEASSVQQVIAQSDASTFGVPRGAPGGALTPLAQTGETNDAEYDVPAFGRLREREIAQQAAPAIADSVTGTAHVGYFIVTVTGPRVAVDYYSAPVRVDLSGMGWSIKATPRLSFTRQDSFGYSLNGREFLVPEGGSYSSVTDEFSGTKAAILGGINADVQTDAAGRRLAREVTTGWSRPTTKRRLLGDVLTLQGLAGPGAHRTDTFALAMSVAHGSAGVGMLVSRDAEGRWVNTVELNVGGRIRFVRGPWKAGYALGTYGIDARHHLAWAVVDHDGQFALADRLTSR